LHPPLPPSGLNFVQEPDQFRGGVAHLGAFIEVRVGCIWRSHEFPKKIGIRDQFATMPSGHHEGIMRIQSKWG
jgi:hypothetical protein